jgi:uncharacterized RDD family membrane protein YckC
MVWYYAEGDRQKGPISDEEFQELVQKGRIHQETLIWKDGMDNWQPLENAREAGLVDIGPASPASSGLPGMPPTPVPGEPSTVMPAAPSPQSPSIHGTPSPAPANAPACVQCGRSPIGAYDGVQLGNLLLCRNCDADLARHYHQSGIHQGAEWAAQPGAQTEGAIPGSVSMPYASILSRVAAKLIDNLLETVVLMVILALTTDLEAFSDAVRNMAEAPEQLIIALRPFLLGSLVFKVLYETVLISRFGATLGKMALGIKVVVSDGSRARVNNAVIRAVAPAILQLPGVMMPESLIAQVAQFLFLFGYLIAVFDLQKRTLYDHAASTRVVRG